ncbi:hypothetical protein WA158_000390 [Blastocystis sp. Blastoise]
MKFIYLLCFVLPILGEFVLSPAIGSHMVLQRAPNHASIYGSTDVDDTVTVTFKDEEIVAKIEENGLWRALLPAVEADNVEYKIKVASKKFNKEIVLEDIVFGDVWLCSGQSNMEMTVGMSFNAEKTFQESLLYPNIRLFSISHNEQDTDCWDDVTTQIVQLPWSRASPEALGKTSSDWSHFSATCWYYGLHLHKSINVPVGLIATSWGGTNVEAWSAPSVYTEECPQNNGFEDMSINPDSSFFSSLKGPNENHSSLWNGMLHPFIRTTIKGAIWYQGEANEGNVGNREKKSGYACRFPAMIASWRQYFSQLEGTTDPNFPFGFVSITPWCEGSCDPANQKPDTFYGPAEIRWAQQANYVTVPNPSMPNVFMAMDYDLEDIMIPAPPAGQIHPRNKNSVGERLALAAYKQVYGAKVTHTGPVLESCVKSNNTITIYFDKEQLNGEFIDIKQTYGYDVEIDNNNQWYSVPILRVADENAITIDTSSIQSKITGVRYAWRNSPCCPLLRANSNKVSCLEKSCAVYSSLSDLPAVPFTVKIADDKCVIPQ